MEMKLPAGVFVRQVLPRRGMGEMRSRLCGNRLRTRNAARKRQKKPAQPWIAVPVRMQRKFGGRPSLWCGSPDYRFGLL